MKKQIRILVIDDDPGDIKILKHNLNRIDTFDNELVSYNSWDSEVMRTEVE